MRELRGPVFWLAGTVAVLASLFHLWTGGFGFFEPREQRSIHLLILLPLAFILYPATESSPRDRPSVVDWVLSVLAVLPSFYSFSCANGGRYCASIINLRFETVDPVSTVELACGVLAVVLVIEALRRAVAPALAGLVSVGMVYLFVTEYMPGILHFRDIRRRRSSRPCTCSTRTASTARSPASRRPWSPCSSSSAPSSRAPASGVLFHNLGMARSLAGRPAARPRSRSSPPPCSARSRGHRWPMSSPPAPSPSPP